jgi:hypothetical protein
MGGLGDLMSLSGSLGKEKAWNCFQARVKKLDCVYLEGGFRL